MPKKNNKKKGELTPNDIDVIEQIETFLGRLIDELDRARKFNMNDYLICSQHCSDTGQKVLMTNSYGTPIKFRIVHVDANGMPYAKEINSSGDPRGDIINLVDTDEFSGTRVIFEHDPHFLDAIILSTESEYDPTENQRKKKQNREDIIQHNTKAKVNTLELKSLIDLFATMVVGQTWWFSTKNYMHVIDLRVTSGRTIGHGMLYRGFKHVFEIDVRLSNGNTKTYHPHDFLNKNLYSKQPRSYKELSDSI